MKAFYVAPKNESIGLMSQACTKPKLCLLLVNESRIHSSNIQ